MDHGLNAESRAASAELLGPDMFDAMAGYQYINREGSGHPYGGNKYGEYGGYGKPADDSSHLRRLCVS